MSHSPVPSQQAILKPDVVHPAGNNTVPKQTVLTIGVPSYETTMSSGLVRVLTSRTTVPSFLPISTSKLSGESLPACTSLLHAVMALQAPPSQRVLLSVQVAPAQQPWFTWPHVRQ